MSKLIVVSNRVAKPGCNPTGGLAVALEEALKKKGGVWCGWSGNIREYPKTTTRAHGAIDYVTLDMTQADYDAYYVGFSNSLLWPLFHYRMGFTHYTAAMHEGYQRVNRCFAEAVARKVEKDDTVWVHDYHLLGLGAHLRELGVKERLGFFLHIPFPAPEVLTALPVHRELVRAMCAYDLLGFQTEGDLQSFVRCIEEIGGGRLIGGSHARVMELHAFGRRFKAGCFPIGIDTRDMEQTAREAASSDLALQLKRSLNGRSMLIGVDRMDYTKGLPMRLAAYDAFLAQNPDAAGKVSYIQITPSSRTEVEEYRDLCEDVEHRAAHINGAHATIDWVPIRYLNQSFSRAALAGFYRAARVGLVTPLRDGMNLVAKEYVAAQDAEDPGVLVLSGFAGAAQELTQALIVNPYDTEGMGRAIRQALVMPLEERKQRHAAMMQVLRGNDIFHWRESFLSQLTEQQKRIELKKPVFASGKQPMPTPVTVRYPAEQLAAM